MERRFRDRPRGRITNVRNSGAAFGFALPRHGSFSSPSVVVAIGLVIYVVRKPSNLLE